MSFGAVPGRAALTEDLVLRVNINDTFPPEAVPDLSAAATVTEGQVLLTWTAPDEDNRVYVSTGKVSSYLIKYATYSIVDEIAAGGAAASWWARASIPADTPPTPTASPGTAETPMILNLAPGTAYWFALRSLDEAGNLSPLDALASTPDQQATVVTRSLADLKTPAPVAGFVVTASSSGYTVTWPEVTENDDGTPIVDLASYRVYRSPSLFDFGASSVTVATIPVGQPRTVDIPTPLVDTYYLIVGLDTSGRYSLPSRSNYLHVTPQQFLGQTGIATDGTQSRAYVPEPLIPDLKTPDKNFLLYVEPTLTSLAQAGGSRTRATYTICLREPSGTTASAEKTLSKPQMTVVLDYQGANGALDKNKTGVLWWNGATWVKVGQANVTESGVGNHVTVSFNTAMPGVYQIRQFDIATELTLDKASVFPQIFSPNGDGINDVIYFMIENPKQSSVSGKILDMGGAEVGILRPAGAGAPTADTLTWDGKDSSGHLVPPGVYIYKITGEGKTITGSLVVAR